MDKETCKACVEQLAKSGFGGAYLHTRLGMLTAYLSEAYLDASQTSVAAMAEQGLVAHLYDEDRWPSGWAGGAVPLQDEKFRLQALVQRSAGEPPPKNSHLLTTGAGGESYYVETMALGHPKFSGACYTNLTSPEAVDCFLQQAYEPLAAQLGQQFGASNRTIFTDEPALTYLYTWPAGGLVWSEGIATHFEAQTGRRLNDVVPSLFEDTDESPWVRLFYYRICAELFAKAFMIRIHDWCQRHNIRWTGHFMYEHSLPLHFSWSINSHPSYRHFDWPGVDHLGRQVGEVVTAIGCRSAVHQFAKPRMMTELYGASGQHLSFADRKWIAQQQIVLGANHLVPHLMTTTLLGARKRDYPPTLSSHQPWWEMNYGIEDHLARLCELMSEGQGQPELLIVHPQESVFVSSRGPVQLGKSPTWVGRFFHPADDPKLNQLDDAWKRLCHRLLDAGYVFDFGDESILAGHAQVVSEQGGAKLRVGEALYRAVVLPPLVTIRTSTIALLKEFADRGGTVIGWQFAPDFVDGRSDKTAGQAISEVCACVTENLSSMEELIASLLKLMPPELRICEESGEVTSKLWRYSRVGEERRIHLLVNVDRLRAQEILVRWPDVTVRQVTVWHTHQGFSQQLEARDGQLALVIPEGSACCLIEGDLPRCIPQPADAHHDVSANQIDCAELDWEVTRLDDNSFVVDLAEFRLDDGRWRGPFPVLAIKDYLDRNRFEGSVALRFCVACDFERTSPPPLQIIVEGLDESGFEVHWNGRRLTPDEAAAAQWRDSHWRPIPISPHWIDRENDIEVRIDRFRPQDIGASDPRDRLGTDLESLILLGDFSVTAEGTEGPQNWEGQREYHTDTPLADWLPAQPMRYFHGPFTVGPAGQLSTGDVTNQGLPFYCGRLRYKAELRLPAVTEQSFLLCLNDLQAPVVGVTINGNPAGCLAWPPYELDVSPWLQAGDNILELTLYHSLRNLLGPHHHPQGEPVYVTPGSFTPEGIPDWLEQLIADQPVPGWRTDYSFVRFGLEL